MEGEENLKKLFSFESRQFELKNFSFLNANFSKESSIQHPNNVRQQ